MHAQTVVRTCRNQVTFIASPRTVHTTRILGGGSTRSPVRRRLVSSQLAGFKGFLLEPPPAAVISQANDLANRLWAATLELANSRFQAEREALVAQCVK